MVYQKTKAVKNYAGTLYALYQFRIYTKKKLRFGRITRQYGNDTTNSVMANYQTMFRNSFLDALHKVNVKYGFENPYFYDKDNFDYDAKLISYYFVYRDKKASRAKGKRYDINHFEKEIPNITNNKNKEKLYETILEERESKKPVLEIASKRTYKARQITRKKGKTKGSIIQFQKNKSKNVNLYKRSKNKKLTSKTSIIEYQKNKKKK